MLHLHLPCLKRAVSLRLGCISRSGRRGHGLGQMARISTWRIDLRRKRAEPAQEGKRQLLQDEISNPVERHRDRQLAAVPENDWQEIKRKAIEADSPVSVNSMVARAFKQANQREAINNPPPIPEGQYTVILADPPWRYEGGGGGTSG